MTLRVGTTPHSQWQVLKPLLTSLGWHDRRTDDPETWYQKVEVSAEDTHILLHSRPEVAIALAIEAGQSPSDALQAWRTAAEQLLAFYKRNRARSVMVEVCSAWREPQTCVVALKEHLSLKTLNPVPELAQLQEATRANQSRATQFVGQCGELASLLAELEACTLPLDDQTGYSPSLQMLDLYTKLQEGSSGGQQYVEECGKILKAQTRLEEQFESERRIHIQIKNALDEAREESDLILSQLFKVQEEFERYYLERTKQDNKFKEKNNVLKKTSARSKKLREHDAQKRKRGKLMGFLRFLVRFMTRKTTFKKDVELLAQSELFDAEWYLKQYPDVANSKFRPEEHYLRYGANEQRDPSTRFSTKEYLRDYADVAESGMNPLVHYLRFGKDEARLVTPSNRG